MALARSRCETHVTRNSPKAFPLDALARGGLGCEYHLLPPPSGALNDSRHPHSAIPRVSPAKTDGIVINTNAILSPPIPFQGFAGISGGSGVHGVRPQSQADRICGVAVFHKDCGQMRFSRSESSSREDILHARVLE